MGIKINGICYVEGCLCRHDVTRATDHFNQLFSVWFGQRFVLLALSIDVSVFVDLVTIRVQSNARSFAKWADCFLCVRLPIDWKTPFGYTIAMIYYSAATYSILYSIVPAALYFLATFVVFICLIKDILRDVNDLRKLRRKSQKTRLFCSVAKDFSIIKQLSAIVVSAAGRSIILIRNFSQLYEFRLDFLVHSMTLLNSVFWFYSFGFFCPYARCYWYSKPF